MPNDPNSLDYDTPNFTTPGQVEANRAYALALMKQGLVTPSGTSGNVTAVSPFAIGTQALQSALGRYNLNQAGGQEVGSMVHGAQAVSSRNPPGMDPINSGAPQNYGNITSKLESGGNYSAVGPTTSDGDHAYGKYQVKGSNIGPWTQEVTGRPMTPQEFIANPQVQDAVYQRKFVQEYLPKYGPEGAFRAWYGGEGNVNNPNARDLANPNAPTVGQYGQRAMGYAQVAPSAGQFAAGSPQATAAALARPQMQPPAPSPNVPGATNPQGVGGAQIPSGLVPQRPQVTREQLTAILANPYIDPAIKRETYESYMAQGQPMQLQGPYGSQVIVNPRDPSQQMVIPPPLTQGIHKVGPIENPVLQSVTPPGYTGAPPNVQTFGRPQSNAAPMPGAPAPSPAGMPPAQPVTRSALDDASPTLTDKEQKAAEGGEPLNYAANESPLGGALSTLPPEITKGESEPKKASLEGNGPLGTPPPSTGKKVAQAGPTPDIDASDAASLQYLQDLDVKKAYREEGNKQAIESARKFYEGVSDQGLAAMQQRDELDQIQKVVNSPDFYSGFGGDWVMAWKRMKAALGGDPNSAAAMETFEKMRNDLNLTGLRTSLGGLGQIRLAEIQMINSAFANKDNSIAANKALIFMKKAINDRIADGAAKANDYVTAHGGVADQSLRNRLFNFYKNTPLMSDEQIKQFQDQIATESAQKPKGGNAAPAGNTPLPQGYSPVK